MIEQLFRPEQIGQAIELKARFGSEAVYMGGGSKLNATPTRTRRTIAILLDKLGLNRIEWQQGALRLGATCTLQAIQDHPDTPPALTEALGFVYSRHLRNQSTLGGELASLTHDSVLYPVLLVLEARLLLEGGETLSLEAYLAGRRDKLVLAVLLPEPTLTCATRRIRRNADGLGVVTAAVALDKEGRARIALAEVERAPRRLHDAERGALAPEVLEKIVAELIQPECDLAGSREYKRYITGVVVADLLIDCQQSMGGQA